MGHNDPVRLETPRLVLRRWRDHDIEDFAALNADPEVMEFFPSTITRAETEAMIARFESHHDAENFGILVVEHEGRLAGFTGLNRTTFETPMGPHVEVGWRLARWAWGRGLATEAATAVLDDGFDRCGLEVIHSFTTERNERSRAVMRRLGMTRRPDFDFDHPRTPGWWGRRHVVYTLRRADRPVPAP